MSNHPLAITCLPGLGYAASIWHEITNQLPCSAHLLSFPGYSNDINLDTLCHDLAKKIPENKKTILIGWSLGGMIAIRLCALYPQRFSKLILIGSTPRLLTDDDWQGVAKEQAGDLIKSASENPAAYLKQFHRWVNYPNHDLATSKKLMRHRLDPHDLPAWLTLLFSIDVRAIFNTLTLPILHLVGQEDAVIPPHQARDLFSNPHYHLHEIPHAGHGLFISHQQEVINRLSAFLC